MRLGRRTPEGEMRALARSLRKAQRYFLMMGQLLKRNWESETIPWVKPSRTVFDEYVAAGWIRRLTQLGHQASERAHRTLSSSRGEVEELRELLARLDKDVELLDLVGDRENLRWSDYQREELLAILERMAQTFGGMAIAVDALQAERSKAS